MTVRKGSARAGEKVLSRKQPSRHLASFNILGLYAGTRAASVAAVSFEDKPGVAWVDLDRGLFYRKPIGKAEEENKRGSSPLAGPPPHASATLEEARNLEDICRRA